MFQRFGGAIRVVAVGAVASLVLGLCVYFDGFTVRSVDLHDGGVWVTNDSDGAFGRMNGVVSGLDAYLNPPGQAQRSYRLDVFQDGGTIVGRDSLSGRVFAIDPVSVSNSEPVVVHPDVVVAMGGGSLVSIDASTGAVRGGLYSAGLVPDVSVLGPEARMIAELGEPVGSEIGGDIAVSLGGTVFAVLLAGKAVRIPVAGYSLGEAETLSFGQGPFKSVQISVVGETPVLADSVSGKVIFEGGGTATVPGTGLVLQQPGVAAEYVLTSSDAGLFRVYLDGSGRVERAATTDNVGGAARPVHIAGCDFGAWAGVPGHVVRACGTSYAQPQVVVDSRGKDVALTNPALRVNRDQVVLNDAANGLVYDLATSFSVDDWEDIKPQHDDSSPDKGEQDSQLGMPKANQDSLAARAGRVTTLHVLDNDSNPGGGLLAITEVTQPDGAGSVAVSPDSQSVQLSLPAEWTTPLSFSYTVSNGKGEASASVSVQMRRDDENEPPYFLPQATATQFVVPSLGQVAIPVVGEWRDPDGDSVFVVSAASASRGSLPVTSDGLIRFSAPRVEQESVEQIDYIVSDGYFGAETPGTASVRVLGANAVNAVSPVAHPDIARGTVGQPVVVFPLSNDVVGADPRNLGAKLQLAGDVASQIDLDVVTDLVSGQVSATAAKPGVYLLDYTLQYGSAPYQAGRIRLDIVEDSEALPIAVPDSVAVRGQTAAMVDVLANDFSPSGQVLTVQLAEAAYPDQLSVGVFKGRWVRISPKVGQLSPKSQIVSYTLSDGIHTSTGTITVTQMAAITADRAIVSDDTAFVRSGNTVLIPVLNNDRSESGTDLLLDVKYGSMPDGQLLVSDPAGQYTDSEYLGQAYVSGNKIRFNAPADVTEARQVIIQYTVATAQGDQATGVVRVTVNPEPDETRGNTPPIAQGVEARGVSGERIVINIPTDGVDPDGDVVSVRGLASAPQLGRIVSVSPIGFVYESFPFIDNVGSDSFQYEIVDSYGATAVGTVRIGLSPPGLFQAPMALDDFVTVQPGATVRVFPMVNDLLPMSGQTTILPSAGEWPPSMILDSETGPLRLVAPGADEPAVGVSYYLKGVAGFGPPATITVRTREGYLNPPQVRDHVAEVDGDVASIDVFADGRTWDIDSTIESLRVLSVGADGATIDGGSISIPVTNKLQVVPYVVADGDGATSSAVIYVPAMGSGVPRLISDGSIEMSMNESLAIDLNTYIESPRGTPVRIVSADDLFVAPSLNLSAVTSSNSGLSIIASNDYVGPGGLTVRVTDSEDPNDPAATSGWVTIPIQVGPPTPVLRCPTAEQTIVAGGNPLDLDIAEMCYVWTATGNSTGLEFTASWESPFASVTTTSGTHIVSVVAGGAAIPEDTSVLVIGVLGSEEVIPARIPVRVIAAPKPTLALQDITDVQQGISVTQTIALTSPLSDAVPTVVGTPRVIAGPGAVIGDVSGTSFSITPDADINGVITIEVTASDLADAARTDRQVTGVFTVTVYGRPEAPTPPQPGEQLLSHSASITWTAGAANGAQIEEFEIQSTDGAVAPMSCGRSTRCDVAGLTNGVPISFQARARNKAGWSDWSAPGAPFTPNEVPGAAGNFRVTAPLDHKLVLAWEPAPVDGTPVTAYHLTGGGEPRTLPGNATSVEITGLDNDLVYTFSITAENAAGLSHVNASTKGQSSGKPLGLTPPTVTPQSLGPSAGSTQVRISWGAARPNGPAPTTYIVTRTGGSLPSKTFTPTTETAVIDSDNISYDGTVYTYSVVAVNATGGDDHTTTPQSTSWTAIGQPPPWDRSVFPISAEPTGNNGEVKFNVTYPPARGATLTLNVEYSNGATQTLSGVPTGGVIPVIKAGFTNGESAGIRIQMCNEGGACVWSHTSGQYTSATPFGPLVAPTLTTTVNGRSVCASASGSPNGREATLKVWADNPSQQITESGTSQLDVDTWCVVAPSDTTSVTFHAQLLTSATTPSRGDSGIADAVQAPQPDAPLPTPTLTVETDSQGTRRMCAYATANGGGIPSRLTMETTAGTHGFTTQENTSPQAGSGSLTVKVCVIGDYDTSSVNFKATLANTDPTSSRGSTTTTAARLGTVPNDPGMATPTIQTKQRGAGPDYFVCAKVDGNADGRNAQLKLWADGKGSAPLQPTGAGSLTAGDSSSDKWWCVDAGGPQVNVTFRAQLVNLDTTSARGDSPQASKSQTAPAAPWPAVSLSWDSINYAGNVANFRLHHVRAGTYHMQSWYEGVSCTGAAVGRRDTTVTINPDPWVFGSNTESHAIALNLTGLSCTGRGTKNYVTLFDSAWNEIATTPAYTKP